MATLGVLILSRGTVALFNRPSLQNVALFDVKPIWQSVFVYRYISSSISITVIFCGVSLFILSFMMNFVSVKIVAVEAEILFYK